MIEVEAANEEEAEAIAAERWAQSEDPANDFCGNGQGVEAAYIEMITDDA